jgi:predicted transcriptional regulator
MFKIMHKPKILEELKILGLDEIQSDIYIYILENGRTTPLKASRDLHIDRTKIYRVLDELRNLKLVEVSIKARGKEYINSSLENIEILLVDEEEKLKNKKIALRDFLSDVKTLIKPNQAQFDVKHFYGIEGFKQMYWNTLSADKEILLFGYLTRNDLVGKSFAEKTRREIVSRNIKMYEITNTTVGGNIKSYTDIPNWYDYNIVKGIDTQLLEIKHNISIYNDIVSIMNWYEGEMVGIEIQNRTYADTQRQMFWKFWELSGKVEKIII